jgi:cyanophycinase
VSAAPAPVRGASGPAPALALALATALLGGGGEAVAQGALVAAGGGPTVPEIAERALALAGGAGKARVLIVPQASSDPEAGEASATFWREAGAANVAVLDLAERAAALAALRAADLIWIPGGDQNDLVRVLAAARLVDALVERHRAGAVVGGTSAGAAALSAVMLTGEADLGRIAPGRTGTADGLGLWPGVIVDQHVLARRRLNRLIAAVLDRPDLVGVGVDESTAVIVTGSRIEVVGRGQAVVVDARAASERAARPGEPSAAKDVRLHVLRPGMTLDLAR